jgi:uncharacterized protein (DUF952 family)
MKAIYQALLFLLSTVAGVNSQDTPLLNKPETPKYLLKIVAQEDWQKSQSLPHLILGENDKNFIHFSTDEQVHTILTKNWANKKAIVLKINTKKLPGNFKFEANKPGGEKYYHLYGGCIPMDAVVTFEVSK